MPRNTKPAVDAENPEWTRDRIARAKRFEELPEKLRLTLSASKPASKQTSGKEVVSIRLSPDVLAALRATGRGWQGLVDKTLRDQLIKNR